MAMLNTQKNCDISLFILPFLEEGNHAEGAGQQDCHLSEQIEMPYLPQYYSYVIFRRRCGGMDVQDEMHADQGHAGDQEDQGQQPEPVQTLLLATGRVSGVTRCVRLIVLMKMAEIRPAHTDSSNTAANGEDSWNIRMVRMALVSARPMADRSSRAVRTVQTALTTKAPTGPSVLSLS